MFVPASGSQFPHENVHVRFEFIQSGLINVSVLFLPTNDMDRSNDWLVRYSKADMEKHTQIFWPLSHPSCDRRSTSL